MAMPEPSDPVGFWDTVKDMSIDQLWPPDDENDAWQLAAEWNAAADLMDRTAATLEAQAKVSPTVWTDTAGVKFYNVLNAMPANYRLLAQNMRELSAGMHDYGNQIREARLNILFELAVNIVLFAALMAIPGGGFLAAGLARIVANRLTSMLAGLIGRALAGGLARALQLGAHLAVEMGKEAIDEMVIDAATQLTSMAMGTHTGGYNVDQTVKAGVTGAVGGVLGEGLGKITEPLAKGAEAGLKKFMPDPAARNIAAGLGSMANNSVTSPSAGYLVNNYNNLEALRDPRGWANEIRKQGLAAGLTGVPRSMMVDGVQQLKPGGEAQVNEWVNKFSGAPPSIDPGDLNGATPPDAGGLRGDPPGTGGDPAGQSGAPTPTGGEGGTPQSGGAGGATAQGGNTGGNAGGNAGGTTGGQAGTQAGNPSAGQPGTQAGDPSTGQSGTQSGDPSAGQTGSQTGAPSAGQSGSQSGDPSAGQSGNPSGDPSAGQTGTQSGDPSAGQTGTQSGDPSAGEAGSQTGNPSTGQSGSQSGDPSAGQAGTQSGDPSTGQTGTQSGDPSAGEAGTRSGGPSSSQTGTQSSDPSTGQTGTQSSDPSTGQTGTQSSDPSAGQTGSQSGDPSTGQSGTQSGDPSTDQSGTQSGDPSAGQTGSQSGDPSSGQTGVPSAGQAGAQSGGPSVGQTFTGGGAAPVSGGMGAPAGTSGSGSVDPGTGPSIGAQTTGTSSAPASGAGPAHTSSAGSSGSQQPGGTGNQSNAGQTGNSSRSADPDAAAVPGQSGGKPPTGAEESGAAAGKSTPPASAKPAASGAPKVVPTASGAAAVQAAASQAAEPTAAKPATKPVPKRTKVTGPPQQAAGGPAVSVNKITKDTQRADERGANADTAATKALDAAANAKAAVRNALTAPSEEAAKQARAAVDNAADAAIMAKNKAYVAEVAARNAQASADAAANQTGGRVTQQHIDKARKAARKALAAAKKAREAAANAREAATLDGKPPPPVGEEQAHEHHDRQPDNPSIPVQSEVHCLGTYSSDRLTIVDGVITEIDHQPVAEKLRELSRQRAEQYYRAKLAKDPAGRSTGEAVAVVLNVRTGQVFESTNEGPKSRITPDDHVHPKLKTREAELTKPNHYPLWTDDGTPASTPNRDLPGLPGEPLYRHAEVRAANEHLHTSDDVELADLLADVWFTRSEGPVLAPFCANCAGLLHDVRTLSGRREYSETNGQRITTYPPDLPEGPPENPTGTPGTPPANPPGQGGGASPGQSHAAPTPAGGQPTTPAGSAGSQPATPAQPSPTPPAAPTSSQPTPTAANSPQPTGNTPSTTSSTGPTAPQATSGPQATTPALPTGGQTAPASPSPTLTPSATTNPAHSNNTTGPASPNPTTQATTGTQPTAPGQPTGSQTTSASPSPTPPPPTTAAPAPPNNTTTQTGKSPTTGPTGAAAPQATSGSQSTTPTQPTGNQTASPSPTRTPTNPTPPHNATTQAGKAPTTSPTSPATQPAPTRTQPTTPTQPRSSQTTSASPNPTPPHNTTTQTGNTPTTTSPATQPAPTKTQPTTPAQPTGNQTASPSPNPTATTPTNTPPTGSQQTTSAAANQSTGPVSRPSAGSTPTSASSTNRQPTTPVNPTGNPPNTPSPGPRPRVSSVKPVDHSAFAVKDGAGWNGYVVEDRARRVVPAVARDAGVSSVTKVGLGEFEVTRHDGTTFRVRVVSQPVSGSDLADVRQTGPGTAEIRVSPFLGLTLVGRAVANALAQASSLLNGNQTTDVLGRDGHPGSRTELSPADQGRQAEVRHLDRTRRETARLRVLRRKRIAGEMKVLVEHLGLHPDDPVSAQRRAVAEVGATIDKYVRAGDRRPAWALPPTGYPKWKAFLAYHLPAEIMPGVAAGGVIAVSSLVAGTSPIVGIGVAVAAVGAGVSGTLIKRWYGRTDKANTDAGHGLAGRIRNYEAAQRRRQLIDPLLNRLRAQNISGPGPAEPDPGTDWPAKHQSWAAQVAMRGGPLLVGAALATPLVAAGLPVWNALAHWGVAGVSTIFGPFVERYLRNSLVRREWALLDDVGRQKDEVAAEFDRRFAEQLAALLDRIDNVAGQAPAGGAPRADPVQGADVNTTRVDHYGANQVGQFGNLANSAAGAAGDLTTKGIRPDGSLDPAVVHAAVNGVLTGGVRAVLGLVINAFLDRNFITNEYKAIVEQVHFDFGNKMAEQVTLEHQVLTAMLADLTARVDAAEAAANRVDASLASRVAQLQASTPAPPTPGTNRPVGHQRWQAFLRLHSWQAATTVGVTAGAAWMFSQGVTPVLVLGGVGVATMAAMPLRYLFRHSEQVAVDETIFADRAAERPVEAAEAQARKKFFTELLNREVEVATGQRTQSGPPAPPGVPTWPRVIDPAFADQMAQHVAHERELLFHEPRPLLLLGQKLVALQRLERMIQRVRDFTAAGEARPATQARADLHQLWQAFQKLKADGTPMPTDHELLANEKPQGLRGGRSGTRPSARLRSYVDNSVSTPAGRAYYAPGDKLLDTVGDVLPAPGLHTVDMHGGPDVVRIGSERLTVDDLATLVEADPKWRGEPIRLLACETGQHPDGFAQRLADRLGVVVHAPSDYVGVTPDGRVYVTRTEVDESGITRPVHPPTGTMNVFHPTGTSTEPTAPRGITPPSAVRQGQWWPDGEGPHIGEMREPAPVEELGELTLMREGPTVYTGAERLWPDELADLVAAGDGWTHGPVRLQVRDGHVDPEFVRRLADLLGVPVVVPGSAVAGDFPNLSSGTLEVYNEPPGRAPAGCRVYEPRTVPAGKGTS